MALISVIVPVYKVEKYLHRCIDSILSQTFIDFELILVDDGSPDNSGKICDEYAEKDNRIYVIHQENGGLSAARNAAIDWVFANSNSQWLTFIDSDDWVHLEMLDILYNSLKSSTEMIAVCEFEKKTSDFYVDTKKIEYEITRQNSMDFFAENSDIAIVAVCKLYHKSLFENNRFPVGKLHEDVFLTYKLFYLAKNITYINYPLYYYYQNDSSIVHSSYSLKKLNEVEAGEEQLEFFKKTKDDKNIRAALKRLMYYYTYHIEQLNKLPEGKKYARKLKCKLKKLLIFKSNYCRVSINENMWYYETAFPLFMKCYFIFKKIISLFSKKK